MRRAVALDRNDATRVGLLGRVPVAGIREVEAPIRPEGQVVRAVEFLAVRFGDEDLDLARRAGLLDRGRPAFGCHPDADARRLGRTNATVAAEHTGIRATADMSIGAGIASVRISDADRARIDVGVDDPAVVELVRAFGMPKALGADDQRLLHCRCSLAIVVSSQASLYSADRPSLLIPVTERTRAVRQRCCIEFTGIDRFEAVLA